MVGLVAQIRGLSAVEKHELRDYVRQLYSERVRADYVPSAVIERDELRETFVLLGAALAILREKI